MRRADCRQLSFDFTFPVPSRRKSIAARNARICAMRRDGARVKEIAVALGVGDHVVSKVLKAAGMTSPHEWQYGPKKALQDDLMPRGKCLACRQPFMGHRWQYRCDECLHEAAKICIA